MVLEHGPHRGMIRGLFPLAFLPVDLGAIASLRQRRGNEDVIQPQAIVLGEGQHPVVPPRVQAALGMVLAEDVD